MAGGFGSPELLTWCHSLTRVARERSNCKDRLLNYAQHKLLRVQGQYLSLVYANQQIRGNTLIRCKVQNRSQSTTIITIYYNISTPLTTSRGLIIAALLDNLSQYNAIL